MSLTQTVSNSALPVDITLARQHIGLSSTDTSADAILTQYIKSARSYIERETDRILLPETWAETFSTFPLTYLYPYSANYNYGWTYAPNRTPLLEYQDRAALRLTLGPITAVSVQYYDATGTLQTLNPSTYNLVNPTRAAASIVPTTVWPACQPRPDSVTVTFTVGYSTPPDNCVAAILALAATWYSYRESESEKSTKELTAGLTRIISQLKVEM